MLTSMTSMTTNGVNGYYPNYLDSYTATLGALTEDDKKALAERVKNASLNFDVIATQDILRTIPTEAERSDIALKAIATGGDAQTIRSALDGLKNEKTFKLSKPAATFWAVASTVSMAACAYHGYKRNNSIGWAIGWAFLGTLAPILAPAIAIAQGFGKPKKIGFGRLRGAKSNRRRR